MARTGGANGFLGGIFWGGVVVVTTLIALSHMAPLPPEGAARPPEKMAAEKTPAQQPAAETPAPQKQEAETLQGQKLADQKTAPEVAAKPDAPAALAPKSTPNLAGPDAAPAPRAVPPASEPAPAAPKAEMSPSAEPAPQAPVPPAEPPQKTAVPDVAPPKPVAPQPKPAANPPPPEPARPEPARPEPAAPSLPALQPAFLPPPALPLGITQTPKLGPAPTQGMPGLREPSRLPQISASVEPGLVPQPMPRMHPAPGTSAEPKPETSLPRRLTSEPKGLPGVAVAAPKGEGTALPQMGQGAAQSPSALQAYARPFQRSPGKPLFAILLRDIGDKGVPRKDLLQLPFPVTVVIDPLAPDAKEAAAAWRQAGQEVVLLADRLPAGAKATDVAQSFETLTKAVPEAVAVLDPGQGGFQDDRGLSALVVPEIAAGGRGLLTWDGGLDVAGQIARREGLPATVVYRRLDGEGESQPVMRRYLDRAAFKAGQEGQVVVFGDTQAATLAVILAWALEGKGASVDLAPISAVLMAP